MKKVNGWISAKKLLAISITFVIISLITIGILYLGQNSYLLINSEAPAVVGEKVEFLDSMKDKSVVNDLYLFIGVILSIILITLIYIYKKVLVPYQQLQLKFHEIGFDGGVDSVNNIQEIFRLLENMSNNNSFVEMLDFISKTFSAFIPYNYIGIGLLDKDKKILKASYGVADKSIVGLPETLIGKGVMLSETSLGNVLESGEARIINDLEEYTKGKPVKLYNRLILEAGIRASITLPLKVDGELVGVIFFSSSKKNVYEQSHISLLEILVTSISVSFKQNILIDNLIYSHTLALANLAETRDEDTGEHLDRMKAYSVKVAHFLYEDGIYEDEVTLEFISQVERFSPLHDIGKVAIPDYILLKPAKLSEEETKEMRKHATFGAEVLMKAEDAIGIHNKSLFGVGIEIAQSHHEKWDGSGYPYGKSGLEIPLSARIVAVGDVFDALTSERPYKKAFSFEHSFNILVEDSGTHFDPLIISSLIRHKTEFYQFYQKVHGKPTLVYDSSNKEKKIAL